MKNKRTFLASLALGVFLLAVTAPIVDFNEKGHELGINKDKFKQTRKI